MDELKAALIALIDERLTELGVIEAEAEAAPPPPPAKGKKPAAPGKGKHPEPTHTLEECKEQLVALVAAKDKQAAIDALSRFGCKKLPDLKSTQIDEFYDYLVGMNETGGDPADGEDLFGS